MKVARPQMMALNSYSVALEVVNVFVFSDICPMSVNCQVAGF
jgi:hypothetical protein